MLTWYATSGIGMRGSRFLEALCFVLILLGWYRCWLRESRSVRESISPERLFDDIVYETDKQWDDLGSLLDMIPGMIIVMRADGTAEYVNRRLMEHNNHATRREYDNLWWTRMLHPDDVNILAMQWEAAVIARTSFACEYRTKHFDGTALGAYTGRTVPASGRRILALVWRRNRHRSTAAFRRCTKEERIQTTHDY
jgi:PAS domain-containing protein